jgi:excisionase family DNA binding protein
MSMEEPASLGRLVSPKTAGKRLDCSVPTIYRLLNEAELESIKLGKHRKILERSIDALIARRLGTSPA